MSDENKFGQKLLEKMGWEKGSGLGAAGQGQIDPITVKQKDDSKGIGYKVSYTNIKANYTNCY